MIGLRVQCDADECGRHFDTDLATEIGRVIAVPAPDDAKARQLLGASLIVSLPKGWTARPGSQGVPRVLCADHA